MRQHSLMIPEGEQRPDAPALPPLARNLDRQLNKRSEDLRIVLAYLAKNAVEHASRSRGSGKIDLHLVHETPAPGLARLQRLHHRVTGSGGMLARVLVARRIAAADMPADHADPQMEPAVPGFHAFFASSGVGLNVPLDRVEVAALIHEYRLLVSG